MRSLFFTLFLLLLNSPVSAGSLISNYVTQALPNEFIYVAQLSKDVLPGHLDEIKKLHGVISAELIAKNLGVPFSKMVIIRSKRSIKRSDFSQRVPIALLEQSKPFIAFKDQNTNLITNSIERNSEAQIQAIQPPASSQKKLTDDLFFPYQWGLLNQSPTIINEYDDTHNLTFKGVKGVDIGWLEAHELIKSKNLKLKKEILVAVLDSGVNLSHPDLEKNIFKNEKECKRGKIIRGRAELDNDKNGFPGDCMGWNFTAPTEKDGKPITHMSANRPFDDIGHGTHIAGIIAATPNNGLGISGVHPNIKILPVKVIHRKEGQKTDEVIESLTHRIAKGIAYAIKMKADVINISLGWPHLLQTDFLKKVFDAALARNITIVAAIGNNEINKQIFPCSLKGVFCVGSVDADGKISEFSNFGGHVDFMAPGDNILSTYPMTEEPIVFSVKGYEVKSGTSQASPYVAGMIATLKGIYPDISNDELFARLKLSQKSISLPETKFVSGGLVKLDKAILAKPQPVVLPDFHELSQVKFKQLDGTFKFSIPIKNYWMAATDITVNVRPNDSAVNIEQSDFPISELSSSSQVTLPIEGNLITNTAESEFYFDVTVTTNGESKTYRHVVSFVRDLDSNDPNLETFEIKDGNEIFERLKTVIRYNRHVGPMNFYTTELIESKSTRLEVFIPQNGKIIRNGSIVFSDSPRILDLLQLDLNYDGVEDFFVRTIVVKTNSEDEKVYSIEYHYLDHQLRPLFPEEFSSLTLIDHNILLAPQSMSFYKAYTPTGEAIALPLFINSGSIPPQDRNPKRSDRESLEPRINLYYHQLALLNDKLAIEPRLLTNFKFDKSIRKLSGRKFYEDIVPFKIFPQSKNDLENGVSHVLLATGLEYSKSYFRISITSPQKFELNRENLHSYLNNGINFHDYQMQYFSEISSNGDVNYMAGLNPVGFFLNINSVSTLLKKDGIQNSITHRRDNLRDHFVSPVHSFVTKDSTYSLYLTKSKLLLTGTSKGQVADDSVIYSMSAFLPGRFFKQFFHPVTAIKDETRLPGIYVNDTNFNGNRVFTRLIDEGKIVSPANLSLYIGESCRPLNPVNKGHDPTLYFSILCQESENKSVLKLVPIVNSSPLAP